MNKFIIILIGTTIFSKNLFAAEAGMPQLDPKYWASQAFWLIIIFFSLYILMAKIFIPKIKENIDAREEKIRKDLEEAKSFREEAEKKLKTYNNLIEKAKLDSKKILQENRQKLNEEIKIKRTEVDKEIQKETINAEKEIKKFKAESTSKISLICEDIVTNVLKDIFGEEGNKSSIKAAISEIVKKDRVTKS